MAFFAGDVKRILKIKLKPRQDDISDQYNRIFMTKMALCSALVVGFEYFNDEVACMVPRDSHMTSSFVHSTCWIQGFYIYEEMARRVNQSSYFGIPSVLENDGLDAKDGRLCSTGQRSASGGRSSSPCLPMTKTYYSQYQYLPFLIGALTVVYYLPYIVFRVANSDILSLKDSLKGAEGISGAEKIVKNFFNPKVNNQRRTGFRVAISILIKVLYLLINASVFSMTDSVLYGRFRSYGIEWTRWMRSKINTHYNSQPWTEPTPGSLLLPPMGFCDIHEASKDVKTHYINKYKFICELSPHIIYQYVLLVLWFSYVCGIIISALGLTRLLVNYIIIIYHKLKPENNLVSRVYHALNLREMEYMDLIRAKSLSLFADVTRKLKVERAEVREVEKMLEDSGQERKAHL